jgi:hypothetical protein
MSCLTQSATVNLIHHYCDIGVWTRMAIRFSERVAFVDDRTDKFLTTLARLGGYCTVEQAQAMGLASSASQVQALLNGLERAGFLRRVAEYPLVYQVTKSVVRLIGTDLWARRQRAIETVRWRLAVVGFYLEARQWPADFFFQHEEKIAALAKVGCSRQLLPQRGGLPYLADELVMDAHDGGLSVAIVDRPHWTAFLQLLHFVTRFARCRASVGQRLTLIVAVGSEARQRMYERAARHRRVIEHCKGAPEPVSLYKVSTPTPNIRTLTHDPVIHANLDSRRP